MAAVLQYPNGIRAQHRPVRIATFNRSDSVHLAVRVSLLLLVTACASANRRATPRVSGTVPFQLTVRGSLYSGTAILDDQLKGTFAVSGPVEVKGSLKGTIVVDSLTLELSYATNPNNCTGTMTLTGAFASKQSRIATGTTQATDSCVGRMTGTFRLGQ
jgi:hypothetical protein